MIKEKDIVTITAVPQEIEGMPEETIDIFAKCVGKSFPVSEIEDEQGYPLFRIEVNEEVSGTMKDYLDTIWIEEKYLKKTR